MWRASCQISGDGNFLIFASDLQLVAEDTNTERDVYLRDLRPWRAGGPDARPPRLVSSRGTAWPPARRAPPRDNAERQRRLVPERRRQPRRRRHNGEMDAFVRDYRTNAAGVTVLVSYNRDGAIPNAEGERPQLDDSATSSASSARPRIVQGDTNKRQDAFVRNWKLEQRDGPGTHVQMLAVSPTGDPGACPAFPTPRRRHARSRPGRTCRATGRRWCS